MKRKHAPFIICPFEVKAVDKNTDPDNFIIDGLASPYGNIDSYRDIVMPGSFTTDIISKGSGRPILWQHNRNEPIGKGEIEDQTAGLACRIKLPKKDTFVSGRVIPQVEIGSVTGLSIGYRTIKEEWDDATRVNRLLEIELKEISLVTFPANDNARITAAKEYIKSFGENPDSELSFKEYPLADDKTEFDSVKSFESLKEHIGLESKNYEKCFLVQNGEKSQVPYTDFVKGELRIIPAAIYSAAASFICSKSDNSEAKEFINKIYAKMGQIEPFKENEIFVDLKTFESMKNVDLTAIFDSDVILSNSVKNHIVKELGSEKGSVQPEKKSGSFLEELKELKEKIGV
jgi:HK97 family phage prohead protease